MLTKIILADDEERWRLIVHDFLEQEGYQVYEAADGQQAVDLLRAHPDAALVILDIMMPVMDGLEACREIRRFSQVPVLMVTAREDEETEVSGMRVGADQYISKPIKMRAFMERVKALLRRSGKDRELLCFGPLELDPASGGVRAAGEPELRANARHRPRARLLSFRRDIRPHRDGRDDAYLKKAETGNKVEVSDDPIPGGKPITTVFRTLSGHGRYTLLEAELVTGRTHQIRAHLAHMGCGIIGDPKYGNPEVNREVKQKYGIQYQMLHAAEVTFCDSEEPFGYLAGKTFRAEIPPDFARILVST